MSAAELELVGGNAGSHAVISKLLNLTPTEPPGHLSLNLPGVSFDSAFIFNRLIVNKIKVNSPGFCFTFAVKKMQNHWVAACGPKPEAFVLASTNGALESSSRRLQSSIDVRIPGRGQANSHGARPAHLIITMIKWIRTSRLSIKNSLSLAELGSGPARR